MPTKSHRAKNRFTVEGLESRILLSAVPMDVGPEVEEQAPNIAEVQVITEAAIAETQTVGEADSLWAGASALDGAEAEAKQKVYLSSDGLVDASGQLLQALEPGMEVVADVIYVGDGTVLESVSLKAESIHIGEVTWKGESHLDSSELNITGVQTALDGASLSLTPGADDAPIYLGQVMEDVRFGLDEQEIKLLSDAELAHLTIGSDTGSHIFTIDGLEYEGALTLKAPVEGGEFFVLSDVEYTGGAITYVGTGNTQNTSADTLTEGVPVAVDDSVELVYTVDNNNIIRIDTTDGGNTAGADISITGDIRGTDEGAGGTLILNAGTGGTILIGGNIGTSKTIQKIIIENAAEVIIEGNIQVEEFIIENGGGDVTLGTNSANFINIEDPDGTTGVFDITTAGNVTINGDLDMVDGDATVNITGSAGSRQLWIKGTVGVDAGDLTIERANRVLMSGEVVISGALSQLVGLDNSRFENNVSAGTISLICQNEIRFLGNVLLLSGDLTLVTNNIEFLGGNASVTGALDNANLSISNAYFRPSAASGEMNIGSPVGAGSNFSFSTTDIAAIEDGWQSINFGYDTGATNLARIGSASFLDALNVYSGSFLVNGPLAARTSMDLDAATGDMEFTNGALVSVVNEQVSNTWQASSITMTADLGDILFNNGASTQITNTTNPSSTITMTATVGDILDQSANPGFQGARDLDLTAGGRILLYTTVENLWADSTVSGDIEIRELDGLHAHSVITANGAILLDTGDLTQVDLAQSLTDHVDNTIEISALGSILVGEIFAGAAGNVTLTAENALLRVSGLADADHRVEGNLLTLQAENGIGAIAEPLLIRANSLDGNNLTSGDIRITQDATRAALAVQLDNDSITAGDLVSLDVLGANVTVTGISNDADGGIYLEVEGDLLQAGDVISQSGTVRLSSTGAAEMAATTLIESNGGDVSLVATTGITLAADASVLSGGGNVFLQSPGDIQIGVIDARDNALTPGAQSGWGNVALITGGSLHDHSGSDSTNIYANELHLRAATGIGQLPDGTAERTIEIDAGLMAALVQTSGVIALSDVSDLNTGVPQVFTYDLLDESGDLTQGVLGVDALAGISNTGSDGTILISAVGTLTLKSNELVADSSALNTTAAGNIALLADALIVEDAITTNGGSISADITNAITLGAGVVVSTNGTGTIALRSSAGSILAAADSSISAVNTNIVLSAQESIELGTVSVGTGAVGLTATSGSIEAAAGGTNVRTVVTAGTLAMVAGGLVSGPESSIERFNVSVNTMSLSGGTGTDYRVDNDKDLIVNTTSASANLYSSLMVEGALELAAQSDFKASGEGNIDLNVQGALTLAAGREISTTGAGTIDVTTDDAFTMGALSGIENVNGTIHVTSGGTISVAQVTSTDGDITVESQTGTIIDSDPTETLVLDFSTAGHLDLKATNGIGLSGNDRDTLTVSLGSLSATTAEGGIFISSAESFIIDEVLATGTAVPVIITSDGSLTVQTSIDTTGDLVLQAGSNLIQSEDATILAGADIALKAGGAMTLARVVTTTEVALEVTGALMGYASPAQAAISASALLLNGVGSVGSPAQPLLTDVSRLAGQVSGGALALVNESDLTIGAVTVETIPVGTADSLPLTNRTQTGDRLLINGSATGVFIEVDGSFTTESVTDASLQTAASIPVLVESAAAQTWNGRFTLGGGAVTLRAGAAITLDASDTLTTSDGTLLIESAGQMTLAAGSVLSRGTGNLIIDATGNIVLNGQITGTGHAALLSDDAILAGAANSLEATDLILSSVQGIASSSQSLTTAVDRLAARAGASGIYLDNSADLVISNLGVSLVSLAPGAVENAGFSGFVGGVVTRQGGIIEINAQGTVTVDPIAASIDALPGTNFAFSLRADDAGLSGNDIGLFIVRDDSEAVALSSEYSSEDNSLTIYIDNAVNTLGEILNIINNHPDFPAYAVLSGGLADGSTVFDLSALTPTTFITAGGSEDGARAEVAGTLTGGAEAIASSAQVLIPEEFFTIRITSDDAGATINNVNVRLLNEGPIEVADGGRLNPGTDAALIEWDGSEFLNIYVNYGFTTVGTVIDRINEQAGVPFSAQLGGTFSAGSLDVVIGDAPVLMESNLRASAILRLTGSNNDIEVTASSSGPLFNGVNFVFIDNGTVPENGAMATFDPVTNVMTLQIQSAVTTASQVVAALNLQGTFTAELVAELGDLNNGGGAVQAQRFITTGGAVAVQASAVLGMIGSGNDVTLTSVDPGDDFNNIEVRWVADTNALPGSVAVDYDVDTKRLTLTVNPLFTSAAQVVDAINAATTPFTATAEGSGSIELAQYPATAGGTGSAARAEFTAAGDDNDFGIIANTTSTTFINTQVYLIDDGSITDGSATAAYSSAARELIITLQSGVTTANTVLAAINDAAIPMTATLLTDNDGSGVYHLESAVFAGGVDAISASTTVTLPSGAVVTVTADEGGVDVNGIEVAFAINSLLPDGSAAAGFFENGGKRILQLSLGSASTELSLLASALAAADTIPFTLTGDLSSAAGNLVVVDGFYDGSMISLTADDAISLIGAIDSQMGAVTLTSNTSDLSFDSTTAGIDAIDAITINVAGSLANLASLESPLMEVYDSELLSITTGSQSLVSTRSVYFKSAGDITIAGAGLAVQDSFSSERSIRLDAANDINVEAPVRTVAGVVNADGIVFTIVKSDVDGNSEPLTESVPVAISEDGGNYTIYVLPEVATHADIVNAINALEVGGLSVFFANLGRQDGTLAIADNEFFITSLTDAVIRNVTVEFADLGSSAVEASFTGTTLTLLLDAADDATVEDVLLAINGLSAFAATTSTIDTSVFLRGAAARNFVNDYTIDIVADAEQATAVVLNQVGDTYTLNALAGTVTRLDLLSALTDTGLFAGSVPELDARLLIGGFTLYLNTGATLSSVNLSTGFVADGTLKVTLDEGTGALDIVLNNVDAASGQDVINALEALDFIVYSLASDVSATIDAGSATAELQLIPEGTRTAALSLADPISVNFPVSADGVFTNILFEVEGMLIALNWAVPTVSSAYTNTTLADSLSSEVLDDASGPAATLSYGGAGIFASSILALDGVDIAIAARSTGLSLTAGNDLTVTASGLLGGGAVDAEAGNAFVVAGAIEGGDIDLSAVSNISQSGTIETTGSGTVRLISEAGAIQMSGTASTTSESGSIFYQADGAISIVSIVSTDGARIDLVSGAAITDALTDASVNISTQGFVALTAQSGIGAVGTAAINTVTGSIQLRNFGTSGDVVVAEANAGLDLTVSELTQNATGGWSILTAAQGDVIFTGPVTHLSNGSLFVQSSGSIMTQSTAPVTLGGGLLTFSAGNSIDLDADISTSGGDVTLVALSGTLSMLAGTTVDIGGGDGYLSASGNQTLAQVTTTGSVRVQSASGSILRSALNDRTNLIASTLQLYAGLAVGSLAEEAGALITDVTLLNATAASGVLAIRERNDLSVGDSTFNVSHAQANRGTSSTDYTEGRLVQAGAGNAAIRVGGALTVESISALGTTVSSAGNLLLDVTAEVLVDGSVEVTAGSLQWISGGDFTLNADLDVTGGTLLLQAGADYTQSADTSITVTDANTVIESDGAMTLGSIDTGAGDLALSATAAITQHSETLLEAAQLRVSAGGSIATAADPLNFDTTRLSVLAGGSAFLNSANALVVDTIAAIDVDTITVLGAIGTARTVAAQSDLTTTANNGSIVLQLAAGGLTLNGGLAGDAANQAVAAHGSGNILLNLPGALMASADISSGSGHITVVADGAVTFNTTADIATTLTGTVYVESTTSTLTMSDNSLFSTGSGDVILKANHNLTLGGVSTTGDVGIVATLGSILDGGDTYRDVIADGLLLNAGTSIGLSSNALDLSVSTVSSVAANGGIFLKESNGLTVGDTSASIQLVGSDSTTTASSISAQSDLRTLAGNGSIIVEVAAGNLILQDGTATLADTVVSAHGTGNILMQTLAGSLTVNADILTSGGNVSILSTGAIELSNDISITTELAASLTLVSGSSTITQGTGGTLSAQTGDVILEANGTISISGITTGGNVGIISTTGSILDNEAARRNIIASALLLRAGETIASGSNPIETAVNTVSAVALDGGIFLLELDAVTVTSTEAATLLVLSDDSTVLKTLDSQSGLSASTSGSIVLRNASNNITVAVGNTVSAEVNGHILLDSAGSLTINGNVSSEAGNITLEAQSLLSLASDITVSTGALGEIVILGIGSIDSAANSRFINATGNIFIVSVGDINLSGVQSSGKVAIFSANGSISAAGSDAYDREVIASELLLRAPAGRAGGSLAGEILRIDVDRLAALSLNGVYVTNGSALRVDAVTVPYRSVKIDGTLNAESSISLPGSVSATAANQEVRLTVEEGNLILGQLNADSVYANVLAGSIIDGGYSETQIVATDAELIASGSIGSANTGKLDVQLEQLALSSGGSVFLSNDGALTIGTVGDTSGVSAANTLMIEADGAINLNQAFTATSGDGLLSALNGTLTIDAVVTTGDDLSLLATASVLQNANVSADGTLDIEATAGAYTMLDAVTAMAVGNLRVLAGDSILTGGLSGANLMLDAGTSIDTAGATHTDLTAANVQLIAGSFIGQAEGQGNGHIQANIDALAASAGTGSIFLVNAKSLSVATIPAISVNRVMIDNTTPAQAGLERIGLTAHESAKLVANGSLTIDAALSATNGDLLLRALSGNLAVNAAVDAGATASLLASAALSLSADGSIVAGSTLDLQAAAGSISMVDGATASATGNLRMLASGDILLGGVSGAKAYLDAGGAIIDNGETDTDIQADQIQLIAGAAVGEAEGSNFGLLEISATALAVDSGSGVFIDNSTALQLTTVSAIEVAPSPLDSSIVLQPGVSLSGLSADGAVILTTEGSLTIDQAIATTTSDNVLLVARADNSDLLISAAVTTAGGNVSLIAGHDLTLSGTANVTVTAAPGTIDLQARTGSIAQDAALNLQTTNANILLQAADDVRLGLIHAGTASVGIIATAGSILDNKARSASLPNTVTANALSMIAGGNIGLVGAGVDNAIETQVNLLSAATTVDGSIHIREFDSLTIDTVTAFSANRVALDNTTGTASSSMAARSDLRTAGNGNVILRSVGTVTLNGGLAGTNQDTAVFAAGTGNVLIDILAINGDVQANAQVISSGGNVSLLAGRAISLAGNANIIVNSGLGSIDLNAARGNIIQSSSLLAQTAGGNILFRARDNVEIGVLDARSIGEQSTWGHVGIIATNGSITDAKLRTDTAVNIYALAANLSAAGSIGVLGADVDNAIETEVSSLAALTSVGGGIHISESSSLTVDTVATFSVNRVAADATTGTSSSTVAARSDLRTAGNGSILLNLLTGDLTLNGGLTDANADNALVANGSGEIMVDALAGSITTNGNILSTSGAISLTAHIDADFAASVEVATSGPIVIDAETGSLTVDGTATIESTASSVSLSAGNGLSVGNVLSSGDLTLISTLGNILLEDGLDDDGIALQVSGSGNLLVDAKAGSITGTADILANSGSITLLAHVNLSVGAGDLIASSGAISIDADTGTLSINGNAIIQSTSSAVKLTAANDLSVGNVTAGAEIVILSTTGDITINDTIGVDGVSITATASGHILVSALGGAITVSDTIRSATGSVSILAENNLVFQAGADLLTSGSGTLDLSSNAGLLTLDTASSLTTAQGDIRVHAASSIQLGALIHTTGVISLLSDTGAIIDGASTSLTASALRVVATGFGSMPSAVDINVNQFAASVTSGGIYFSETSAIVLGRASAEVQRVATDAMTSSVTDAALTGLIATTGAIVGAATGTITIETVVSETSIDLTSTLGQILDGGEAATDLVAPSVTLTAKHGLGSTGSGVLEIDTNTLDVTNLDTGSVYLEMLSAAAISGIDMQGAGNLFLNQIFGNLTVSGAIAVTDGSAVLLASSSEVVVNSNITATSYLRMLADSLDVNGATLAATAGEAEIRVRKSADFDASSSLEASGDVAITAGDTLNTSDIISGGDISIRARNDILRNGGEISGGNLKIQSANGQIGTSDFDPILTNVDRIDVTSAGEAFISEANGVEFGRTGINTGSGDAAQTVNFKIGSGAIGSVNGGTTYAGSGTLRLEAAGEMVLANGITASNGSILIVADSLTDGTSDEGVLLQAANGRVTITATNGIGASGVSDIEIISNELVSTTATGNNALELGATSTIVGSGVTIGSGAGSLIFNQTVGNLFVHANLAHGGSGILDLDVVSGTLSMNNVGRITTNSGSMNLLTSGNMTISRIEAATGTLRMESLTGSIRRLEGRTGAHIIAALTPSIFVETTALFSVDSNAVRVNGVQINRTSGLSLIQISLNFS